MSRFAFAALFVLFLYCFSYNRTQTTMLANGECLRDGTFEWTEAINIWFREHIPLKNVYMIYCAFLMDFMMVGFLFFYFWYWQTGRIFGTLALFYPIRQTLQNNFFMGRQAGFLWFYPGLTSLTIPYFDTNDFYFSGHVGSSAIFASEYFASGWSKMCLVIIFVVVNEWVMLTFLRTHYIIDLITGLIVARLFHMWGEKLAYLYDVKLMGLPYRKRQFAYYEPC